MVSFTRRGLHGRVVDVLGEQIVSGDIAPATIMDIDELMVQIDVSRTVVREAMKVLAEKGLVDARPHRGTFVLPRERWNLLDADVIRWRTQNGPDRRLMAELAEVRQIIEPWGARLAAERRSKKQLTEIEAAYDDLATGVDEKSHTEADVRFHRAVLAGSQNELLLRLEIVLEPALQARDKFAFSNVHTLEFLTLHRDVLDCIRDGDPDAAFAAMNTLLLEAANFGAGSSRAKRGTRQTGKPAARKKAI